jgi:hypothetical protein
VITWWWLVIVGGVVLADLLTRETLESAGGRHEFTIFAFDDPRRRESGRLSNLNACAILRLRRWWSEPLSADELDSAPTCSFVGEPVRWQLRCLRLQSYGDDYAGRRDDGSALNEYRDYGNGKHGV